MTEPRDPTPHEVQQPDDLAEDSGSTQPEGAREGSGDAELIAGEDKAEVAAAND